MFPLILMIKRFGSPKREFPPILGSRGSRGGGMPGFHFLPCRCDLSLHLTRLVKWSRLGWRYTAYLAGSFKAAGRAWCEAAGSEGQGQAVSAPSGRQGRISETSPGSPHPPGGWGGRVQSSHWELTTVFRSGTSRLPLPLPFIRSSSGRQSRTEGDQGLLS